MNKGKALFVVFLSFSALVVAQPTGGPVYIVKRGDTLWNIAERFLNNPWLWPKIWEQNKYIENPHLIFPGDPIFIPQLKAPPLKVAGAKGALSPERAPEKLTPPSAPAVREAAVRVQKAPPPAYISMPTGYEGEAFIYKGRSYLSFVAPEKPDTFGRVLEPVAEKERTIMAEGDEILVTFAPQVNAKVGDRYYVVRIGEKLKHPVTGKTVGYKIKKIGVIKVTSVEGAASKAVIESSFDAVQRGDEIIRYQEESAEVTIQKTEEPLKGFIVGAPDDRDVFAEGDIVYIDLGRREGVKSGNLFMIYVPGGKMKNPLTGEKATAPAEIVGKLVVLEAYDNMSTAIITISRREISIPARIMSDFY